MVYRVLKPACKIWKNIIISTIRCIAYVKILLRVYKMLVSYQNVVAVDEDTIEVCKKLSWRWELGSKVFTDNLYVGDWTCKIKTLHLFDRNSGQLHLNIVNRTFSVWYLRVSEFQGKSRFLLFMDKIKQT